MLHGSRHQRQKYYFVWQQSVAKVVKTDTKRAYLYCDIRDDVVYIRPPIWWSGSGRARIPPTQEHL